MDDVERSRHGSYHWIDIPEALERYSRYVNCSDDSFCFFDISEGSINVQLTSEEIKYLEEPYTPREIIGHT